MVQYARTDAHYLMYIAHCLSCELKQQDTGMDLLLYKQIIISLLLSWLICGNVHSYCLYEWKACWDSLSIRFCKLVNWIQIMVCWASLRLIGESVLLFSSYTIQKSPCSQVLKQLFGNIYWVQASFTYEGLHLHLLNL